MKQNLTQYGLMILVVIGAYLLGVSKTKSEYMGKGQASAAPAVAGEQTVEEEKTELSAEEWEMITKDAKQVKGQEGARVTIVEFTDYQCPYCARYVEEAYQEIMKQYLEKGQVKYILRDLPLPFHANAVPAAVAARCAGQAGKYWEMHDKLFGSQEEWSSLTPPTDKFVAYAGALGLDTGKFRSCLADPAIKTEVEADGEMASKIGASGTPTFFVNGKALVGAQPFASFKELIEAEL